jgi:phospholipase/carboxylesterase
VKLDEALLSRREFLLAGVGTAALALVACDVPVDEVPRKREGRLLWRPDPKLPGRRPAVGLQALGVSHERDSLLYVPPSMPHGKRVPLVVAFHGAGRTASAESGLHRFREASDETGIPIASPASRGPTWDAILGSYGPDIEVTGRTLRAVNDLLGIDPNHVALAGYSDGASYALSLGIANGDVVTHVIACSPGFIAESESLGTPRIFISHGSADPVLPVDSTSRKIVPALRREGYDVTYIEFPGQHEVPPPIALEAIEWFGGRWLPE